MCKILIEVENGCIQRLVTDRDMTIVVVDRDNQEQSGIRGLVQRYEPDTILPGGENFSTEYSNILDEQDKEIYDELKRLHL